MVLGLVVMVVLAGGMCVFVCDGYLDDCGYIVCAQMRERGRIVGGSRLSFVMM